MKIKINNIYIIYILKYHANKSDKTGIKYYVITECNRKFYFGASDCSDFTIHKDEQRKRRYIDRHKNNEKWPKPGVDTAEFRSHSTHWLLWNKPTIKESCTDIKSQCL